MLEISRTALFGNVGVRPCGVFHGGHRRADDGLQAPPAAAGGEHFGPGLCAARDHGLGFVARVGCAHFHPGREVGDDGVVELWRFFRHLEIGILVADRGDEQAVGDVAGHDRGAGFAAVAEGVAAVEAEAALVLFTGVAVVTFGDEDGADFGLEKSELLGGRLGGADDDRGEDERESGKAGHGAEGDGDWAGMQSGLGFSTRRAARPLG